MIKTISMMAVLSISVFTPLAQARSPRQESDRCVCRGCSPGSLHTMDMSRCDDCGSTQGSGMDRLCRFCAQSTDRCPHCTKSVRRGNESMWVGIGQISVVSKDADIIRQAISIDMKLEKGGKKKIYIDRSEYFWLDSKYKRYVVRAEWFKGRLYLRELYGLANVSHDGKAIGKSSKAVSWRIGGISGTPVMPEKGRFSIRIPAVVGDRPTKSGRRPVGVEILRDAKVIETHRFDGKKWSQEETP